MNKIKIIFLGTSEFAIPSLEAFLQNPRIEISFVITQPDKPVGRKALLTPPPVKVLVEKLNLPIIQPDNVNGDDVIETVKKAEPDFIIVVAYGQILKEPWFSLAKKEILNLHGSLLPKYRGASPIQSAILDGGKKTGVSVMAVCKKLDSGHVYARKEISIDDKNSVSLGKELAEIGARVLVDVVMSFDSYKPVLQNENEATYCKKIDRVNGRIFFSEMDCEEILRRHRAFYGWPGVFVYIAGKRLILHKIVGCGIKDFGEPGMVRFEKNKIYMQSKKGVVEVKHLQLEGKKEMSAKTFIAGNEWVSRELAE